MSKCDEEIIGHVVDTIKLMSEAFLWKYYIFLIIPILIIYEINNGIIFVVFFIVCCLFGRSAKLGGLLGWFVVSLTIFVFFISPEPGHFIEYLLRATARVYSNPISSDHVNNAIPVAVSSKVLWSLVFGLRGGMITGLGVGMLGRMVWGHHPKIS